MKHLKHIFLSLGIFLCSALSAQQQSMQQNRPASAVRIGVVNTKRCVEDSKLGKQEQANFEKMKGQMESVLQEKERTLEEIESKLNDDDYMDSVSEEAAAELRRKRRTIRQEGLQLQSQYMQALQQANYKIVQKLTSVISKASAQVAQESNAFDIIINDEAATFYASQLDISDKIIAKMNAMFDAESKDHQPKGL